MDNPGSLTMISFSLGTVNMARFFYLLFVYCPYSCIASSLLQQKSRHLGVMLFYLELACIWLRDSRKRMAFAC